MFNLVKKWRKSQWKKQWNAGEKVGWKSVLVIWSGKFEWKKWSFARSFTKFYTATSTWFGWFSSLVNGWFYTVSTWFITTNIKYFNKGGLWK